MDGRCRTDEEVDDGHLRLDDLGLMPWYGQKSEPMRGGVDR